MSMYVDSSNGGFTVPFFQEERQLRLIEGTEDKAWLETYVQLISWYVPMTYSTVSSRHANFYLVEETEPQPVGPENSPLVRFSRLFAALPATRTDVLLIAQPFLGISAGSGASWYRYGGREPTTLYGTATDTYDYFLASNASGITRNPVTQSTFGGNAVDYFGTVYATYTPYTFLGFTSPSSEPNNYTVSCEITRWRGLIWQRLTRSIPNPTFL